MNRNNTRSRFFLIRLLCLFVFFQGISLHAQYSKQLPINRSIAYEMLANQHYREAIRQFTALCKQEKSNNDYKLALARAYNYSSIDPKEGLEILEELNEDLKRPLGSFFELGVAYHKNYRFDDAIVVFEELKFATQDEGEIERMQEWIDRSNLAKMMMNEPVEVKIENLGQEVNSAAPDFLPLVEPDESAVYFTTRSNLVTGDLYDSSGYRTADVFVTRNRSDKYSKAKSIGSPNSIWNEYTAGRSENGEYMVYQVDNEALYRDLFVSEKGKRAFLDPKMVDSRELYQTSAAEISGAVSNDGRRIYFSSDREGGMGGFDIWVIRILPTGEWSEAQNLGPSINTPGDEKYPYLRGNEDLIYFSSNGHPGMGGLDLFIATRDKESKVWNPPTNMGFPVNTPDDDLSICYAANSRYAYIGSRRDGGFGDLDIYRLIFKDVKPEYTLLSGTISNQDSSMISVKVLIEVFDLYTGKLYGSYLMNRKTGRYHVILPPGDYRMEINDLYGYHDFKELIRIFGKNDFVPQKQLDITLRRDESESKPTLDTKIEPKKIKE